VSTWFLLIVTFVIYGVLTTASFRDNDPAHFSTVGTSMFSLFRISTMDVSPSLLTPPPLH
jgi:hypothetical protein